jgi:predicted  nucleic acid-binding Zn-ribbon protein
MTKAQQVYERVEALIAEGATKAEAFKQLAAEFGQPVNSVRGAYYQHTKKLGGAEGTRSSRPRRRETTPTDAVEDAIAVLRRSIERIDDEVAAARERATEAQAEYEAMEASAATRKQAIEAKIAALESEGS